VGDRVGWDRQVSPPEYLKAKAAELRAILDAPSPTPPDLQKLRSRYVLASIARARKGLSTL
jgi:hypothetical protein